MDYATSESELGAVEDEGEAFEEIRLHVLALRRHLPLILTVAAVCVLLATIRTLRLPAIYAANASIRLAKESPDPAQAKYAMYWDGMPAEYLNSEIRDMTSLSLAMEVVRGNPKISTQLQQDMETDDLATLANAFLEGVGVHPVESTYVVDISYQSAHPDRCAPYANALAEAYTEQRKSLWGDKTRRTEVKNAEVERKLEEALAGSVKSLQEFVLSNPNPLFEQQEPLLVAQLESNKSSLAQVNVERNRLEAQLLSIRTAKEKGRDILSPAPIADSPVIQPLRRQLVEAELSLANLRQRYGEAWPAVVQARNRRDEIKLLVRGEIELLVSQLESRLEARTAEEQGLAQRARQLREESRALARITTRYRDLKAEVDENRAFLITFRERSKDISTYSKVNVNKVRVVDPAVGWARIGPDHSKNVVTGALLGLVLGVLIALLVDRLADRLSSLQEVQRTLQIPVLGVVPDVTDVVGRALDRYAITHPRSIYAESFRRTRVQLNGLGAFPRSGAGVLLCASGVPQEGKTVCAVNLAVASAQVGKRTLLIDGDIRSPRNHKVFDQGLSPGLVEALDGTVEPREAVRDTDIENLFLMPSGRTSANPGELLARGGRFVDLVNILRGQFEFIVIDSPPIAAFSDGALMAPAADASVLVVSSKTSRRSATVLARTELSRVGRAPCGVVFNQQGTGDYRYFGYYYQAYMDRTAEVPPSPPTDPASVT